MARSTFTLPNNIDNYQLDAAIQTIKDLPGVENIITSSNEVTVVYDERFVSGRDIVESILLSRHIF